MQENEMTAPKSFAATNDERSPEPSDDSVLDSKPLFKNNLEALKLMRRYNESQKHTGHDSDLELIRADEIDPVSVRWLWKNYFPFGKLSLLTGDPGEGKSTFMLTIAAALTRGGPLPFAEPEEQMDPLTVIYQTTEDDPEDTFSPLQCGARCGARRSCTRRLPCQCQGRVRRKRMRTAYARVRDSCAVDL